MEPETPYSKVDISKVLSTVSPYAFKLADLIEKVTGELTYDDFAQAMVDRFGDRTKPYVKMIYEAIRNCPTKEDTKFSDYSYVKSFDINKLQQDTQPDEEEMRQEITSIKNQQDAGSKSGNLTGNRQDTGNEISSDEGNIQGQPGTGGRIRGETDPGTGQPVGAEPENSEFAGGFLLPNVDSPTPTSGKRGDQPVRPGQKEPGITGRPAGDINAGGGNQGSLFGPPDRTTGVEGDVEADEDYDEDAKKALNGGAFPVSSEGNNQQSLNGITDFDKMEKPLENISPKKSTQRQRDAFQKIKDLVNQAREWDKTQPKKT